MSRLSTMLTVVVLGSGILTISLGFIAHHPNGEVVTMYNVHVLKTYDAYRYLMQDEHGTIFVSKFCEDYEPQFDARQILLVLKFQDYGECWSVKSTHPAYLIKRDAQGHVILEEPYHD